MRSAYPDTSDSYKSYLLETYDDTYFPEKVRGAGKASYIKRNQEMINQSRFCEVYYDENYLPPRRKNNKQDIIAYQPKGGTKISYAYAAGKNCEIMNMFDNITGCSKIATACLLF